MKKLLYILGIILVIYSCDEEDRGYLITMNASYTVDTLLVKAESQLDTAKMPNPRWDLYVGIFGEETLLSWGWSPYVFGEDYYRVLKGIPWTSTDIEGVQGTAPIFIHFDSVSSDTGNPESFLDYASVYGDGTIEIPFEHEIPPGRYLVSLRISNEDHEQIVKDVFTVIIQEELVE